MMFLFNNEHSPLQKYFEYVSYPDSFEHLMSTLSPLYPEIVRGAQPPTAENTHIII